MPLSDSPKNGTKKQRPLFLSLIHIWYILHIDLTPVKELISLQRRCSNNLNQVAIHAHTYGVYPEEIDGLKRDYEKLWGEVSKVLRELSELVAK